MEEYLWLAVGFLMGLSIVMGVVYDG